MRGKIYFDDLQWEQNYHPLRAYEQSKLANVYFTRHLALSLPRNVKTASLHPGVVRTEIARYVFDHYTLLKPALWLFFFIPIMTVMKSQQQGAQTSLHCCLCPFEELESGKYYSDCAVKAEAFPNEQWKDEAKKLWELSEKLVQRY